MRVICNIRHQRPRSTARLTETMPTVVASFRRRLGQSCVASAGAAAAAGEAAAAATTLDGRKSPRWVFSARMFGPCFCRRTARCLLQGVRDIDVAMQRFNHFDRSECTQSLAIPESLRGKKKKKKLLHSGLAREQKKVTKRKFV